MEGQAVRILEAGNKYEGRVGRASHFVAGHSASDADPLLVVAVALGRERLGTAGALRCAAAALAAAAMLAYSLSRHASPSKGKKV